MRQTLNSQKILQNKTDSHNQNPLKPLQLKKENTSTKHLTKPNKLFSSNNNSTPKPTKPLIPKSFATANWNYIFEFLDTHNILTLRLVSETLKSATSRYLPHRFKPPLQIYESFQLQLQESYSKLPPTSQTQVIQALNLKSDYEKHAPFVTSFDVMKTISSGEKLPTCTLKRVLFYLYKYDWSVFANITMSDGAYPDSQYITGVLGNNPKPKASLLEFEVCSLNMGKVQECARELDGLGEKIKRMKNAPAIRLYEWVAGVVNYRIFLETVSVEVMEYLGMVEEETSRKVRIERICKLWEDTPSKEKNKISRKD